MTEGERGATILVIDDLEENRMIIRYLFEDSDVAVLEAPEGTTGLELARTHGPDCILLDLSMPGLDGFEVLARLQADARCRDIPVIIITASDDSVEAMDRGLRGGAVDYITKPISPPRVAVRVRAVVERRRLQRQLQELQASFTSMLVHDLRAPLTVIKGYTDLFEVTGGPLTTKQQRYLKSMQESCARMLRLIGDLLDVSKLEAGRLTLERKPVDLGALVAELGEQSRPLAQQKGIDITLNVGTGLPSVHADGRRLEQVLSNLLNNALKFAPERGTIGLNVALVDEEMEVMVEDSGPGIPPEEMSLLFGKFSQTSSGKSSAAPGTGLGLLICRHLVEAHGGRIWAESTVGQGSRFIFRLPVAHSTMARSTTS